MYSRIEIRKTVHTNAANDTEQTTADDAEPAEVIEQHYFDFALPVPALKKLPCSTSFNTAITPIKLINASPNNDPKQLAPFNIPITLLNAAKPLLMVLKNVLIRSQFKEPRGMEAGDLESGRPVSLLAVRGEGDAAVFALVGRNNVQCKELRLGARFWLT